MSGWASGLCSQEATITVLVVVLTILLRPLVAKLRRRKPKPRSGTITVLPGREDAKFEIVAVHGLGADPDHTWEKTVSETSGDGHAPSLRKVHLLRDLLKPDFPQARIMAFADNTDWLGDSPIKTTEEIGKSLLEEIKAKRSRRHLPLIFIGHSLGGIIIKQALCRADAQEIIDDTSGIIFLGTPHYGSSVSLAGSLLASVTGFLGSNTTLLSSLKPHSAQLSNLEASFRSCISPNTRRREKVPIVCFYETKPMYYLKWLSFGLVVSRDSAVVHADRDYAIDTDHSGLNKCAGRSDKLYQQINASVKSLIAPSQLEQADAIIRNSHYTNQRLQIERLSGKLLPMEQCYINLAIVEQSIYSNYSRQADVTHSPFSVLGRQNAETVGEMTQVDLSTIFNRREVCGRGSIEPRRILIRGRAGVGKTTLCKKIVHDFTWGVQTELYRSWTKLFDRLLWVPLRNLKAWSGLGFNYEDFFFYEYLSAQGRDHGRRLAAELWREVKDTKSSRTLFLLDGLDEVSQDLGSNQKMSEFLVHLLNQPHVVITSRPSANLPSGTQNLDLGLETIGFYPEQVSAYIEADPQVAPTSLEIQSFLDQHPLIEGLVRIPIQLDALCYTWEDLEPGAVPKTMTGIYKAIELKLWKKDAVMLGKKHDGQPVSPAQIGASDVEDLVADEIYFLEGLAFTGLHNDVIEFTPADQHLVARVFKRPGILVDKTLPRLSFLRTSDPSQRKTIGSCDCHFLHLTFQEYFAARYFVRQWAEGKPLKCLQLGTMKLRVTELQPNDFISQHKYTARYDILWRFVSGLFDIADQADSFIDLLEKEPHDITVRSN